MLNVFDVVVPRPEEPVVDRTAPKVTLPKKDVTLPKGTAKML